MDISKLDLTWIFITGIIAGTIALVALLYMFMRIGVQAFSVNNEASPRAFGIFFQELPATTTIVLIISAVVALAALGIFPAGPSITLLGMVAGYVLGNRGKQKPD